MRLVIMLLLLVVLPTALLSILAGRSIQAREVILHQRLEQNAVRLIDEVCDAFGSQLETDARRVGETFRDTVLAGRNVKRLTPVIEALECDCPFVGKPYLFMNPWGFVFPALPEPTPDLPLTRDALLRQRLIEMLSAGANASKPKLLFEQDQQLYCFSPMPDFAALYAGFSLDPDAVAIWLRQTATAASTADIMLRIRGLASHAGDVGDAMADVRISDSFQPQPVAPVPEGARTRPQKASLAERALPAPFQHVRLEAILASGADIQRAKALQARLIGWGILLLAIVIMASSTILIRWHVRQAVVARRRSEFVIGMSHDLRTPVASIRMLAESLSAGRVKDPEKQRHFLRTIANECERLGDRIERVLFFFRQEHKALTYSMSAFDAGEMVERTVTAFQERLRDRAVVTLTIADTSLMVVGDEEALAKVVANLLDNAVKYAVGKGARGEPLDTITVDICKRHRRRRDWVVITVADHGPGIPMREQRKIFERFYRSDTETHRHVGGIGLGLALCADIVRAHRGRIDVDSRPGEGALFSVWLRGV